MQFFHPLQPIGIQIGFEQGRASGEADVEFASHEEAVRAMGRVIFFQYTNLIRELLISCLYLFRTRVTCNIVTLSYSLIRQTYQLGMDMVAATTTEYDECKMEFPLKFVLF